MTNLSVLAQGNTNATPNEGNGTSGPLAAGINADADKVLLPLATVTGTLAGSNKYATHATANLKGSAIRHSVAKTKSGAAASEAVSYTHLTLPTIYSV